ncbi:MAG: c-type cytochrome [Colwellia polaris]|jgi:cytochrome c553|uniref:c-type cytochrome n=1 Tax=Colwellia polaris TaxID=326537 RepID=UPI000A174D90|nr:c-type cytochrome [Colwellia polaris]|tara:strand:- start:212 stop:832 length:621 start_codon:yes stop_codon:yes gene_type:complete
MKKFIITILLGLSAIATANAAEGNAEAGKNKSAMCAACHGADGNSLVPMYPKLAGQSASYLVKQLVEFKQGMTSGGKSGRVDPVMGGMAMALSEQDMADVAAFYASQEITAGTGNADALGKKLYLGGNAEMEVTACVACHGINGKGMPSAGFPALASQNAEYLKIQLEKFRNGSRNNDLNGMMQGVAANLTDEEITALSQYMSSLK